MVATFIAAAILSYASVYASDSTYILRLNLPVGATYSYKVITDQFIVPQTAARLHSQLSFDVLSRDLASNLHCLVKMTADTIYDEAENDMYKPEGDLTFVGNKMYSGVGYVDILLDEFGHILSSEQHMMTDSTTEESQTSITRATDAGSMGMSTSTGPYGLNLIIPAIPDAYEIEVGKSYLDTVYFASRLLHMPTHYGTSALTSRKEYLDTLIRSSTLDSVLTDSIGNKLGYMTLSGDRMNAFGSKFKTETSLVRNMRTGLLHYVTEMCYQLKKNKPRKFYKVTATLVSQKATKRFRE